MWIWWVGAALAGTIEVGPSDGPNALQDAVEVAQAGDVIEVESGTYTVSALPLRSGVTLLGRGPDATFVRGAGLVVEPTLHLRRVQNVQIRDLAIDSGSNRALIAEESSLRIDNVRFTGGLGSGTDAGAMMYVIASDVTLERVHADNTAVTAFAVSGGLVLAEASIVTVVNSTFEGGIAFEAGGAISLVSSSAHVTNTLFRSNSAWVGAGAIHVRGGPSDLLQVQSSTFEANLAFHPFLTEGNGGAISVSGSRLHLLDSSFIENQSAVSGGAVIAADTFDLRMEDNWFAGNDGAMIGGAVVIYRAALASVLRNTFEGNLAAFAGPALFYGGSGDVDVRGNMFCKHLAETGGAVTISGAAQQFPNAAVRNNLFVDLHATQSSGALLVWSAQASISNNTFHGNAGPQGAVRVDQFSEAELYNNAFVHNDGGFWDEAGLVAAAYNLYWRNDQDLMGAAADAAPLIADPRFIEKPTGCASTFLPADDSPLIDRGDPSLSDDDGSRSDIGAYGGPGASLVLDLDGDGAIVDDCDPFDPERITAEEEVVGDGLDQDCDGLDLCYVDEDGDGVGSDRQAPGDCGSAGLAQGTGDCDDADPQRTTDCTPADRDPPQMAGPNLAPDAWFCGHASGPGSLPGWALVFIVALAGRRPC